VTFHLMTRCAETFQGGLSSGACIVLC
jgi:hypothetical protein